MKLINVQNSREESCYGSCPTTTICLIITGIEESKREQRQDGLQAPRSILTGLPVLLQLPSGSLANVSTALLMTLLGSTDVRSQLVPERQLPRRSSGDNIETASQGSKLTFFRANVVSDLYSNSITSHSTISFFFCRFDNTQSLKAEVILRSLIRQSLERHGLDDQLFQDLASILEYSQVEFESLTSFYKSAIGTKPHLIVLDGVDECPEQEQVAILRALSALIRPTLRLKIFVTSRESLHKVIRKELTINHHVSTRNKEAEAAIASYVDLLVDHVYSSKELVIGQPSLLSDIKDALRQGAQGMLVTRQLYKVRPSLTLPGSSGSHSKCKSCAYRHAMKTLC